MSDASKPLGSCDAEFAFVCLEIIIIGVICKPKYRSAEGKYFFNLRGIITATGTERRDFERNAIPLRTVDGTLINVEAMQIGETQFKNE